MVLMIKTKNSIPAILLAASILPVTMYIVNPLSYREPYGLLTQVFLVILVLFVLFSGYLVFKATRPPLFYRVVQWLLIATAALYWILTGTGLTLDYFNIDCGQYAASCADAIGVRTSLLVFNPATLGLVALLALIAMGSTFTFKANKNQSK